MLHIKCVRGPKGKKKKVCHHSCCVKGVLRLSRKESSFTLAGLIFVPCKFHHWGSFVGLCWFGFFWLGLGGKEGLGEAVFFFHFAFFLILNVDFWTSVTVPLLGGLQHMTSLAVTLQNNVLCSEVILGEEATGCSHAGSMQLYIVIW